MELAKSDLKAAEDKIPVWDFDSAVKTAQVHALIAIAEALERLDQPILQEVEAEKTYVVRDDDEKPVYLWMPAVSHHLRKDGTIE
ncbi:MAG: hypothetical protein GWO23_09105 [Gammaproteobacteria bacterium]|nr:hypothetical protein [Gammaproteobacteria bacterium]